MLGLHGAGPAWYLLPRLSPTENCRYTQTPTKNARNLFHKNMNWQMAITVKNNTSYELKNLYYPHIYAYPVQRRLISSNN